MRHARLATVLVVVAVMCMPLGSCSAADVQPKASATTIAASAPASSPSATGIDYRQWAADLSDIGFDDADIPGMEKLTAEDCQSTDFEIELLLAQALDQSGQDMVDLHRVNFSHVCPDQLDRFDAAQQSVSGATNASRSACDTPPAARTEEQSLLAEMAGC